MVNGPHPSDCQVIYWNLITLFNHGCISKCDMVLKVLDFFEWCTAAFGLINSHLLDVFNFSYLHYQHTFLYYL